MLMINNIIDWFKCSNRWIHLILGIICGTIANDWYCLEYGAIGVAGALELKDKLWGGKIDIMDFILTIVGFNIGYVIKILVLNII